MTILISAISKLIIGGGIAWVLIVAICFCYWRKNHDDYGMEQKNPLVWLFPAVVTIIVGFILAYLT
ncbi:hypothetical protein [Cutibacterium sp. V947]|uniref:hypothetical protein n=1 Tax=unclassified Cutibacterium TaxID=2649671 RepID=UPI003EDFDE1C